MAKVSTNISIDSDIKAQAQTLFAEFGMDLSTAVNIFLRQAIHSRCFPFEITRAEPNAVTLKALKDAENGVDMHGPFATAAELMEDLNADD